MHYTLHQLQVFARVAQLNSITKAAEELHMTQPAVSIQIKNFQEQFEIPLLEIIGRKIYITDFGKEIALAAENIIAEVNAINFKAQSFKGQLTGKLKISIVSTGKYIMPYFLSDFMKRNQGVELLMDVTNKARVIESLESNSVDFALVSVLPANMQVEKVELMDNKLYLVGNRIFKIEEVEYRNNIFEKLPLIFREQGSGTRFTFEQYIEKNNLPILKKMELTSNEAVKQAVIAGLGFSIMPLIGIKNELLNGDLQIIPVHGFPIKTKWNLIWLKNKKFSAVADSFIKQLEAEKAAISSSVFKWIDEY